MDTAAESSSTAGMGGAGDSGDELLRRAQEGDTAAFESLVEREQDKVYGLALRMTRSEADAAEIVQGSRMLDGGALRGNMPLYKFVANKSLTAIENWAFGLKMAEYHSGYMLYARRAITEIPFHKLSNSFDFDLEMIVMAKVKGMRVREIAIPTIYADEVSHLRTVQYGMRVLKVVRDYRLGKYDSL